MSYYALYRSTADVVGRMTIGMALSSTPSGLRLRLPS